MKLIYTNQRFECSSGFANRLIPKQAGFRWDPGAKVWWTKFVDTASKLRQYADASSKAQLEPAPEFSGEIPAPDGLKYLPYQLEGVKFAVNHPRCLLADDMGLGKTIQAIGLINALKLKRVLVICPASLRINWQRELEKWLVETNSIGIVQGSDWPADSSIVICNYDVLGRHAEPLRPAIPWDLVVFDESAYLKNSKAARTKHALGHGKMKAIPATRWLMATGTPVLNRPVELWTTLHALDPQRWCSWKYFVTRYCAAFQETIWVKRKRKLVWNTSGSSRLEELGDILRGTCMIRRTKEEVLPELPEKRRQIIEFPVNGASAAVATELETWDKHQEIEQFLKTRATKALLGNDDAGYARLVAQLRESRSVAFTEMAKVRHEVAQAKLPQVIDHLGNVLESTRKAVVFAHHKDIVASIAAEFEGSVTLTGATPMLKRQEAIDRFQNDPACHLFVGNIRAAGVGNNLTAGSYVGFAELDWTPATITQCEDRCHRLGQKNSVLVQHLVLNRSLDSKMARMIVYKQEVINKLLIEPEERDPLPLPAPEELDRVQVPREEQPELRAALKYLAERTYMGLDGVGFNRHDTGIGCSLSRLMDFSPRQAALAKKLTHKYRRQLAERVQ